MGEIEGGQSDRPIERILEAAMQIFLDWRYDP
jgi:hypothetical protein